MKLQYRLILMAIGALILGLALHLGLLIIYEQATYQQRIQRELQGRAEILGLNSMAALEFRDAKAAIENLSTLRNIPEIMLACLYLPDGSNLAGYKKEGHICPAGAKPQAGPGFMHFSGPVIAHDDRVGTIVIVQELPDLWQRLPRYGLLMASSTLVEMLLILVMVIALRRRVIHPVNALAQLARNVSEAEDYHQRLTVEGQDEISDLGLAFNRMLATIEERGAAIQENNQLLQALIDHAPATITIKNPQGKYLLVNAEFARLTGFNQTELLGKQDHQIFDVITAQERQEHLVEVLKDDSSHREEVELGKRIWLSEHFPLHNRRGDIRAVCEIATDISQQREIQGQLAASLDQITHLNESLEERVKQRSEELKMAMGQLVQSEKLAALGSLVAGIAHELNTPIGVVVMIASGMSDTVKQFAKAMENNQVSEAAFQEFISDMRQGMQLIERNGLRADKLISNFKQVAVDQTSMRQREFKLDEVVTETLHTMSPLLKNSGHKVETQIPTAISCLSHPGALEQILTNLVQNAIVHGLSDHPGGTINISAELKDGQVVVEVKDNGQGIPEQNLGHLFEPFFTTRLGQGGSGLGLYIVHNLAVGVLGGDITVSNRPEGGACFQLKFPLQSPEKPE